MKDWLTRLGCAFVMVFVFVWSSWQDLVNVVRPRKAAA